MKKIKQFFCFHHWIYGEYRAVEEVLGVEIKKVNYQFPICMYCGKEDKKDKK